jgi:uncharacterized membrane protein YkoI
MKGGEKKKMEKKWMIAGGVAGVLVVALLVGSFAMPTVAQGSTSEADEAAALAGMATVTPEQAKAAALKAYPGTTVVEVELENENGAVVYEVELSNGMDVIVDPGNGMVLYVEYDSDGSEDQED